MNVKSRKSATYYFRFRQHCEFSRITRLTPPNHIPKIEKCWADVAETDGLGGGGAGLRAIYLLSHSVCRRLQPSANPFPASSLSSHLPSLRAISGFGWSWRHRLGEAGGNPITLLPRLTMDYIYLSPQPCNNLHIVLWLEIFTETNFNSSGGLIQKFLGSCHP